MSSGPPTVDICLKNDDIGQSSVSLDSSCFQLEAKIFQILVS